ncbi:geranylgeranylglycerol-phosphate geranylgeranyltransferase [Sediminibacter sp. Hel_I_10]|uniref:geranylgeranylglycerol-phosphate geranylgeranyltransferase n=1 Tax=Sediminibacter sp. Hel_I_10 TaxID=1392490 RepID=UPI000ABF6793|nr:geranylgeranylglycerol-phosphate geranylgeranyltransferase [Sediminibacter sp. Hel_I_10]
MYILNLIRWKNLALILLVHLLIKYALLEAFNILTVLDNLHFAVLSLATICLAAAGNIINDIYDVDTDAINRSDKQIVGKHITESVAYNLFFGFNITGILLGFYLSNHIGKPAFFGIFVITSLALYLYASFLKRTIFIGNLAISILVGLSVLIIGIFDVIPATFSQNKATQMIFLNIIFDYAVFAFMINLVRELIKDIEDIDGDYKSGMNTIPIAIGRERAKKIVFAVSMIPIAMVIYYLATYLYKQQLAIAYFLILIIAPLIYATIKIFGAEHKSHYKKISGIYKVIMLLGMLSLLLYPFILK